MLASRSVQITMLLLPLVTAAGVHDQSRQFAIPEQTAWQTNLFERVSTSAALRSKDAEIPLLQRLDSHDFREGLAKCCPAMGNLSSSVLLKRLQDEIQVSELVSGFPASSPASGNSDSWWNPSIEEGFRGAFFENQWQVRVMHNGSFEGKQGFDGWFGVQDDVEVRIYGLRPFSHRGKPANILEASERGPYCALNTVRADAGSPLYGDVSAVFSHVRAKETALLSAVDTGSFEGLCNRSTQGSRALHGLGNVTNHMKTPFEHNCSAFPWGPEHLGTMDHFNHLFLISEKYWNGTDTLLRTFSRLFSQNETQFSGWGKSFPLQGLDLIHYFESIPAANLHFPQDVKFMIGKFPNLFGTAKGAELQQWCLQRGWMLVWALGLNVDDQVGEEGLNFFTAAYLKGSFPSNRRVLDPTVLQGNVAMHNLTVSGVEAFSKVWIEAQNALARAALLNTSVHGAQWVDLFDRLSTGLPKTMHLEPLRANSCVDVERCIGTDMTGTCVCYSSTKSFEARQDDSLIV